jgi:hypothetical protein
MGRPRAAARAALGMRHAWRRGRWGVTFSFPPGGATLGGPSLGVAHRTGHADRPHPAWTKHSRLHPRHVVPKPAVVAAVPQKATAAGRHLRSTTLHSSTSLKRFQNSSVARNGRDRIERALRSPGRWVAQRRPVPGAVSVSYPRMAAPALWARRSPPNRRR